MLAGAVVLAALIAGCPPAEQTRVVDRLPPPMVPEWRARPRVQAPSPPPVRPAPSGNIQGMRIVVDPGHGGKDPGAQGVSRLPEKTIVLAISNELARRLRERGAIVTMTRSTDTYLTLDQRAAIAERARADLFVSIHADSASRAGASGTGLYIARNASASSQGAATRIQAAFRRAGIPCRGIQRAGFRVLVGHSRPAVLIECGFLTNSGDAQRLNSPSYQATLAEVIAEGIADHLGR